jgi:hypothetical protein
MIKADEDRLPLDYAPPEKKPRWSAWGAIVGAWVCLLAGVCLLFAGSMLLWLTAGLHLARFYLPLGMILAGLFLLVSALFIRRSDPNS